MGALAAYWALTKPGITRLVVLTTAVGFWLGAPGAPNWWGILAALLGTAFVTAGTNALNEWWERDADARMARTCRRPLPSGSLSPRSALVFGVAIASVGLIWLALLVNALTASLAGASLATYVFLYTPLKRRTSLALFVGAVPGALPILGGWTAATGRVTLPAVVLFAILFVWQIPHFLALGWLYREDYRRGGFAMLSRGDPDGRVTGRLTVAFAAALLVTSLLPAFVGIAGPSYLAIAAALGSVLVAYSAALLRAPTAVAARRVFLASIAYLPALLLLLVTLPH